MGLMPQVVRFFDARFEEIIACGCLIAVAVCVFAQVVMRYAFNTGLAWTEELAGYCMVWAVYMGAAIGVRERFHIRIMIGVRALPHALCLTVLVIADLCWAGFNLFMLWFALEYLAVMWQFAQISPGLGINEKWPQSIIFIGYFLITLRLAQLYADWFKGGCKGLPGVLEETGEP